MQKAVVIGYGGMGGWHTERISGLEGLELGGTYDIDPKRQELSERNGIHTYPSFEAVLEDKSVSLVTVAIPNDCHKDVCIRAINAGKNVVCEKPVTVSSADLSEMIEAAHKNNVLFTVHQNRRWDEDFRVIKKIYDENILGGAFNIESRVHGSRGIPGDWRNQKAFGGGMVLDWGVHLFDQLLQIIKTPIQSIYATLSHVTNEEVDDGFKVIVTFVDGASAQVEVGTSNFIEMPRWYMQGENGTAIINNWDLDGKITMVSDWSKRDAVPVVTAAGLTKTMAPRTEETIKNYPLPRVACDVGDFYRNVVDVIENGAEQIVKHDEMLRVMKFVEAVFESAEKNEVIKDFESR